MNDRSFLDTNVFVYDIDAGAPKRKQIVAGDLIRDALAHHQTVVSYQVIQEFLAVALRKFPAAMTLSHANRYLETVLKPMLAVHSSVELFQAALDVANRHRVSWYDSLIVAAAAEANCSVLYTEDLHHGAKFGNVRVENPFRAA
jgi:predicted nucleic acid-binding protein